MYTQGFAIDMCTYVLLNIFIHAPEKSGSNKKEKKKTNKQTNLIK